MAVKEIVIGDISDAWLVGVKDKNKVPIPLTGFTCKLKVVDGAGAEVIATRAVTLIEDDNFVAYLTDVETKAFTNGICYRAVLQVENLSLPKEIKKEVHREFKAIEGYII